MSDELWSELRNELLAEIADLENAMANMPPGALLTRASAEARIGAARSVLTIIDRETSPPSRPTIAAVENALRAVKALESECDRDAANAFGVLVAHADRIAAERDAWSEEAGRRGLELATVKAKYAALLEVCAEFAHVNREGT